MKGDSSGIFLSYMKEEWLIGGIVTLFKKGMKESLVRVGIRMGNVVKAKKIVNIDKLGVGKEFVLM